ncbi:hypothetical protein [Pseudodesulfovibrio sp. S3]|uniref:hypothetical protein n=1 Tax=Pseudodesulfovibrio sp. S3 TaxID=2283629 RepID=UPI0013E38C9B|nr:hypothetical protein [Pseudodesulfovibrio sp. S3]
MSWCSCVSSRRTRRRLSGTHVAGFFGADSSLRWNDGVHVCGGSGAFTLSRDER